MTSAQTGNSGRPGKSLLVLALFIAVTLVAGGAIGALTAPGEWYAALVKPSFNPPSWIFAPVWLTLYVLIGIAGWLVWSRDPHGPALKIWGGQQLLNWLWSPVFFAMHLLWPAVVVIVALFALIVTFIIVSAKIDRRASWLFVPYVLWVGFAAVLNISLAVLN